MPNLKTYISSRLFADASDIEEAISSRRNTSIRFTMVMTIDEFYDNLNHCGIPWMPKFGINDHLKTGKIRDIVTHWEEGYDIINEGYSTRLVVSIENGCYILDWGYEGKHRNGPESGEYYAVKNGKVVKITGDLEKTLDEMNMELGDRYKENGYMKR